jgi:hypothetical protein
MSDFDATKLLGGPAVIIFNGHTYFTEDDVKVATRHDTWDVASSWKGRIDTRSKGKITEIRFKPVGMLDTVAKYYPYGVADIGADIFGTVDKPCVVHTIGGTKLTYGRAAITGIPPLQLGVDRQAFGEMVITCLGKNNTADTTPESRVKVESAAFAATNFDETKILTPGYVAAYGADPYDAIELENGAEIQLGLQTAPRGVNRFGTVGMRLTGLAAAATLTPANLTEAQVFAMTVMDGANAVLPGQSVSKAGTNLVIAPGAGTGVTVTLAKAGIVEDLQQYGLQVSRFGNLNFVARMAFTAGAAQEVFTVAFPA